MSDERVWLRHETTKLFFHCPVGAVDDFGKLGWAPTDERPEEVNPVVSERLAWEAEQRAATEAAAAPAPSRKSTTAPGKSAPEIEE